MILVSSDVVARGDQLVIHTGDVAADPSHLGVDVDWTLLGLRLHLYCLVEMETQTKRLTEFKRSGTCFY